MNMEQLDSETRFDKLDRFQDYSLHLMLPPYDGYYSLKDSGERGPVEVQMKDEPSAAQHVKNKKPLSQALKLKYEAKIKANLALGNRSLADQ